MSNAVLLAADVERGVVPVVCQARGTSFQFGVVAVDVEVVRCGWVEEGIEIGRGGGFVRRVNVEVDVEGSFWVCNC